MQRLFATNTNPKDTIVKSTDESAMAYGSAAEKDRIKYQVIVQDQAINPAITTEIDLS